MTPRDKLTKELSVVIREAFQKGFDSESVSELDNFDGFAEADDILNQYAIGRWVSVDERLPEHKKGFWSGAIREKGSLALFGEWVVSGLRDEPHLEWLDLDLPSGKEEAE